MIAATQQPSKSISEFRMVRLDALKASRTNPRRHFDAGALAELAESIRTKGVLQPILVRPMPTGPGVECNAFELVAGERRFRAAKAAGLCEIPAMVGNLTDVEVLEIQVIENLQRRDLHPLEEAEGYHALHQRHGYTVDDIAAKVGMSTKYVYDRMISERARRPAVPRARLPAPRPSRPQ